RGKAAGPRAAPASAGAAPWAAAARLESRPFPQRRQRSPEEIVGERRAAPVDLGGALEPDARERRRFAVTVREPGAQPVRRYALGRGYRWVARRRERSIDRGGRRHLEEGPYTGALLEIDRVGDRQPHQDARVPGIGKERDAFARRDRLAAPVVGIAEDDHPGR